MVGPVNNRSFTNKDGDLKRFWRRGMKPSSQRGASFNCPNKIWLKNSIHNYSSQKLHRMVETQDMWLVTHSHFFLDFVSVLLSANSKRFSFSCIRHFFLLFRPDLSLIFWSLSQRPLLEIFLLEKIFFVFAIMIMSKAGLEPGTSREKWQPLCQRPLLHDLTKYNIRAWSFFHASLLGKRV